MSNNLKEAVEDLIKDEFNSPMLGSGLLAVSYIDENGVSSWGWFTFGQQTVTDLLGLNRAVQMQLENRINAANAGS